MHWWHFWIFVGIISLPPTSQVLIRRAQRGSERWQHRSQRQQWLIAGLPGLVVAVVVAVVLDGLNVPW
jgi:hypothetical protein